MMAWMLAGYTDTPTVYPPPAPPPVVVLPPVRAPKAGQPSHRTCKACKCHLPIQRFQGKYNACKACANVPRTCLGCGLHKPGAEYTPYKSRCKRCFQLAYKEAK